MVRGGHTRVFLCASCVCAFTCKLVCLVCGFSLNDDAAAADVVVVVVARHTLHILTVSLTGNCTLVRTHGVVVVVGGGDGGQAINVLLGCRTGERAHTQRQAAAYSSYTLASQARIIIHAIVPWGKSHTYTHLQTTYYTNSIAKVNRHHRRVDTENPYKCICAAARRLTPSARTRRGYHNTHKYYVSLMWYFTDYESAHTQARTNTCTTSWRCVCSHGALIWCILWGGRGGYPLQVWEFFCRMYRD